jgi:hypothetical protein
MGVDEILGNGNDANSTSVEEPPIPALISYYVFGFWAIS